jgi:hypothetical protein
LGSGGNLNTARYQLAGAGTQTAGLGFGGDTGPTITSATEEYNGTSWTLILGSLNTARRYLGGSRNSNSSFSFWWRCSTSYYTNAGATEL